jgi:hypothetical protein
MFINPERVESPASLGHHPAMPQSLAKMIEFDERYVWD